MRAAATRPTQPSKLGFEVGGASFLVSLRQVSEVVTLPAIVPVPLTQPWFLGVANVRGNLYCIVDLCAFQGGEPVAAGPDRRVILLSDKLVQGAGLLVSRMLGLRNPESLVAEGRPRDACPWMGELFRDAAGTKWQEIDLALLANDRRFLEVGIR